VAFLQSRLADSRWRMSAMPLVGQPLTHMLFGLPDLRGLSALPVARLREYLALIDPAGSPMTFQQVMPQRSPLYDLAAVRYVAVWRRPEGQPLPALDGDPDVPLVFTTPYVAVYENRAALPRARVVHRSEAVPDAAAARARLAALVQGASHARDTPLATSVVLEPAADGAPPPLLDAAASDADWVRIADAADPDVLRLEAQLARDGLVVVADTYYPGWQASVDGAPVSIHPANALFRAVPVPAGRHTIVMRYQPAALRWGAVACLIAALACTVLLLRRTRRVAAIESAGRGTPSAPPAARYLATGRRRRASGALARHRHQAVRQPAKAARDLGADLDCRVAEQAEEVLAR
jgi:hypothetical protein